jgi:predicted NUDIX family NTP pyrophosphohydrolase
MPSRVSAGLVMYRLGARGWEVLLAHPGGPFFTRKDAGYWTIPKGEVEPGADLLETAQREFAEEVGWPPPPGATYLSLGVIRQKGGKLVHAWGFTGEWPAGFTPVSNLFSMEWPPGSGRWQSFPEVDRVEFFPLSEARRRIKPTQIPLLDELEQLLAAAGQSSRQPPPPQP